MTPLGSTFFPFRVGSLLVDQNNHARIIRFDILCDSSARQTSHIICQALFFLEKKREENRTLFATILNSTLRGVKTKKRVIPLSKVT